MGNLFDTPQDNAVGVVNNTMGYPASWTPSAGGPAKTATVLYNDDTDKYDVSNISFDPYKWRMEYYLPAFPGLKQSVDENVDETVTITLPAGATEFFVRRVDTKFDGKTFTAYLEKK